MEYLVDFESIPWETPMDGLRHKAVEHDGTRLRLVEYAADMAPHWCERGHVGLILDGTFEIEFTHETRVFRSGNGVFIPSGTQHRHMARVVSGSVRALFIEEAELHHFFDTCVDAAAFDGFWATKAYDIPFVDRPIGIELLLE